jgi:hypothetical protein
MLTKTTERSTRASMSQRLAGVFFLLFVNSALADLPSAPDQMVLRFRHALAGAVPGQLVYTDLGGPAGAGVVPGLGVVVRQSGRIISECVSDPEGGCFLQFNLANGPLEVVTSPVGFSANQLGNLSVPAMFYRLNQSELTPFRSGGVYEIFLPLRNPSSVFGPVGSWKVTPNVRHVLYAHDSIALVGKPFDFMKGFKGQFNSHLAAKGLNLPLPYSADALFFSSYFIHFEVKSYMYGQRLSVALFDHPKDSSVPGSTKLALDKSVRPIGLFYKQGSSFPFSVPVEIVRQNGADNVVAFNFQVPKAAGDFYLGYKRQDVQLAQSSGADAGVRRTEEGQLQRGLSWAGDFLSTTYSSIVKNCNAAQCANSQGWCEPACTRENDANFCPNSGNLPDVHPPAVPADSAQWTESCSPVGAPTESFGRVYPVMPTDHARPSDGPICNADTESPKWETVTTCESRKHGFSVGGKLGVGIEVGGESVEGNCTTITINILPCSCVRTVQCTRRVCQEFLCKMKDTFLSRNFGPWEPRRTTACNSGVSGGAQAPIGCPLSTPQSDEIRLSSGRCDISKARKRHAGH